LEAMLTFERLNGGHDRPSVPHSYPEKEKHHGVSLRSLWQKPSFGKSLSHSHVRTNRRWNPNIQKVRAMIGGAPKRINACTSCIRAGKITKPARRVVPTSN